MDHTVLPANNTMPECTIVYQVKQSHSILISIKIRLMKALVWPVSTYGCESWTLRKNEETCLEAFEMKALRDSACFVDSQENK